MLIKQGNKSKSFFVMICYCSWMVVESRFLIFPLHIEATGKFAESLPWSCFCAYILVNEHWADWSYFLNIWKLEIKHRCSCKANTQYLLNCISFQIIIINKRFNLFTFQTKQWYASHDCFINQDANSKLFLHFFQCKLIRKVLNMCLFLDCPKMVINSDSIRILLC